MERDTAIKAWWGAFVASVVEISCLHEKNSSNYLESETTAWGPVACSLSYFKIPDVLNVVSWC
jgi:hypothetical protein